MMALNSQMPAGAGLLTEEGGQTQEYKQLGAGRQVGRPRKSLHLDSGLAPAHNAAGFGSCYPSPVGIWRPAMTFLRRFALLLILPFCASLIHAQPDSVIPDVRFTFTTIDVPGAVYTGVWGINKAGEVVGNYGQDINVDSHGFLYSNGTFTYFDYLGQSVTVPTSINDSGLIVGSAGKNPVVGFLYDGATFTTIQHGNDSATFSLGINNAGAVVGGTGTIYATKGFEMRSGRFKSLKFQGEYIYVYGAGINNFGTVVGWADDNGFVCRRDSCQLIDFPGASKTENWGINDSGIIVGWYEKGPPYGFHSFATKNGRYISFDYPGAGATFATGINSSGQIVGEYTSDFSVYHGFVTSPITAADFERPGCCQAATDKTEH
jgi:probable HAF family extracellular repeat protein